MLKKKNRTNMQSFLFKSYMSTMLIVLLGVTAVFSYVQFSGMNSSIVSNIRQTSKAVSESVDHEIQIMNTISVNTLYSNLLRDSFSEYLMLQNNESKSKEAAYQQNNNAKNLHDIMFAIIGANFDVRQLNLYNMDSGGFGTGLFNGYIDSPVRKMPWFGKTRDKKGYSYISDPAVNPTLSDSARISADTKYISLCRLYFNRYNRADGIVEVVQYYNTVFDAAFHPDLTYNPSVYVYSEDGRLLFPALPGTSERFDYFSRINNPGSVTTLHNTVTGEDEYVCFEKLATSHFYTVTVVNSQSFYAPMINFFFTMLIVILIVMVLCYFFARRLSARLSSPLVGMHGYLSKIDFNNLEWHDMDMPESNIIEINELRKGINLFQQKLKSSMDNIMLLQQHETQSQMLALQSQMNPHFLYNSLSTIVAMAEENMTENISDMCVAITGILRYISTNNESLVTLEMELENTDRYISCLKFRYGDHLNFEIDIDDAMLNMMVPRLCIQLLVENAIKFTTTSVAPPWHIHISCVYTDDIWIVTVLDNGQGFPEDTIVNVTKQIVQIKETDLLPSLELNGMGLLNIFLRLRLLYKEACIFEFGNREQGGAFVRIGGKINVKDSSV